MYRQANINSNVKVKNIANIFQSINTRNKPAFINNNYIHLAPKTLHAGNRHVMNGSHYGTTFFFITFVVVCISFVFSFCWYSLRISILEAKGKNWALILVQMFSFEIVSLIINSFCISSHCTTHIWYLFICSRSVHFLAWKMKCWAISKLSECGTRDKNVTFNFQPNISFHRDTTLYRTRRQRYSLRARGRNSAGGQWTPGDKFCSITPH